MIIRRIFSALRRQDWTTVVIETLIVVLGVYLGILLGNWNSARQEEAVYKEAYNRMIVDLQDNVDMLEAVKQDLAEPIRIVQLAINDLRECRADDEALNRVQAAFKPLGRNRSFEVNSISLDLLVNNEVFLRFQSSQLRQQLLALYRDIHLAENGSQRVYEQSIQQTPELVRPRLLKVPLAQACQDESFLAEFYAWEDNSYYQSIFSSILAKKLRSALEELGHPMKNTD